MEKKKNEKVIDGFEEKLRALEKEAENLEGLQRLCYLTEIELMRATISDWNVLNANIKKGRLITTTSKSGNKYKIPNPAIDGRRALNREINDCMRMLISLAKTSKAADPDCDSEAGSAEEEDDL